VSNDGLCCAYSFSLPTPIEKSFSNPFPPQRRGVFGFIRVCRSWVSLWSFFPCCSVMAAGLFSSRLRCDRPGPSVWLFFFFSCVSSPFSCRRRLFSLPACAASGGVFFSLTPHWHCSLQVRNLFCGEWQEFVGLGGEVQVSFFGKPSFFFSRREYCRAQRLTARPLETTFFCVHFPPPPGMVNRRVSSCGARGSDELFCGFRPPTWALMAGPHSVH